MQIPNAGLSFILALNCIADAAFDCFLNARKPSVFDAKERFVP